MPRRGWERTTTEYKNTGGREYMGRRGRGRGQIPKSDRNRLETR